MAFDMNRRDLFRYTAALGGLVVVGPALKMARAAEVDKEGSLTPMVQVAPDGEIRIYCPSPEMGQGVLTAIPMMFAEEMDADFTRVSAVTMPLWLKKTDDGTMTWRVVPQFSGGSTSIPRSWVGTRELGAMTRALFLEAAAGRWRVSADGLTAKASVVTNPDTGETLTYGELAGDAARVMLPEGFKPRLKPRADWSVIGTAQKHLGNDEIVTGRAVYGIDADYPGAKTVVIARSPYLDGMVTSVDDSAARKVPGVVDVVVMPRPDTGKFYTYLAAGVAVIADTFWAAKKGRDALRIEWDKGPHTTESTESFDAQCEALLDGGQGQVVREDGDVAAAKANARVITRRYRQPFVSHCQLEVQNCVAHVTPEAVTIIGPLQNPSGASRIANTISGVDREAISVDVTRLGGGFGRRLSNDHVAEAVYVSKASGLPVKVIWTREDDLSHDFYRPAGHHELTAGFDDHGNMVSWQHSVASASKYYRRDDTPPEEMWTAEIYPDDFPAGIVPNVRHEYFSATSGMPRGSWRAPAHVANAFAVQSFLDEAAAELGQDPLAMRLKLLGDARELPYANHGGPVFDTGRMAGVLKRAAKMANWGKAMPAGHAQGIAGHFTFGGYCAQVAEVEKLSGGGFKVHRVYCAVDVGTVINPEGVIKQAEGGINDGISTAFWQEVRVTGGEVQTQNFDTYPMLRMADAPAEVLVEIIDSEKDPSGMGEMAIPVIAPAILSALARAGGPRIRHLPVYSEINSLTA
ncbi:xanthine dehydrogenase family protein molybdopterin-binding subunit [Kordiimonas aestuarii]|uniref:xanthine dehydrogenase family protein molybdopterin-binding subunit n=1 Tax=Kordiimonas aestuarii TaxID=1005925 RepID=UPI0021CF92D8|nr:molybdopterin cofactor-binding domain-containing protein [Kordiimonas aestuarii]